MNSNGCKICASPLKSEIEKNDKLWKADKTILWARDNGIRINRVTLAAHRKNHIESSSGETNQPISRDQTNGASKPADKNPLPQLEVDDLVFLDTVRNKAYEKLLAGDFDLKLEAAFKAIEIKYKISDQSSNEKLLLELLNQIRAEELSAGAKSIRRAG